MIAHQELTDRKVHELIRQHEICFGGHKQLKIYGLLNCKTGKKMNKKNRVFFSSVREAIDAGYRPCGHCMPNDYKKWENGSVQ